MKKTIVSFVCAAMIVLALETQAQVFTTALTAPANGGNRKAVSGERIGITDVLINYHRPAVKGREGKIYGTRLVHKGFEKPFAGTSKAAPWRAGANENTTISFSTDVKIEGKDLPAGTYGFFIAYDENECIAIFSKHSTGWGSFFYEEKNDALRVKVKPVKMEQSAEWLKYDFINQAENSATIAMLWEKLMIPFKVEVDLVKTQIESYRKELTDSKPFINATAWNIAAAFCLKNNTNLEEALLWADQSLFWSGSAFPNRTTKIKLLKALNKNAEADSLEKATLAMANMAQLSSYGRELLTEKKNKDAMAVFEFNAAKNPNQYTPLADMTRIYSANGDYKTALDYARKAQPLAADPRSKTSIEDMIKKLEAGKDVN